MASTSLPRVNAQLQAAQGQIGVNPFRCLIVGQLGTSATAVSGQYYQNVQDLTVDEVVSLFGESGELTGRVLRWRKLVAGRTDLWVVGLTAAAGAAATADLAVAGAATEDGTITIKAIDESDYTVTVSVTSGDANTVVSAAIETALLALTRFLATPVDAAGTVTLTAKDVGTIANKYVIETLDIPAGLTVNGNAGSDQVQFSAGATDPSVTTIFDPVPATRFHSISWPWLASVSEVQDFLEPRLVVSNAFLQGVAFIGLDDTQANISAVVSVLNSQVLVYMGNRTVSGAAQLVTPPDWRAAEFMAIEALRLTEDAAISTLVTVTTPLDAIGGPALASLAYYNTPLASTDIANLDELFNGVEQESLKDDGYTIVGVNESRTSAIMGEVVSTYKLNGLGEDDNSFKFLNNIRTSYTALEVIYLQLKADYAQYRLTEGSVVPGRAMTNAEQITANLTSIFKTLGGPDFTLVQAGSDAEQFFYRNLSVTTDLATGGVTITGQLPIVTQVRQFNVVFQIAFTIGG